jgi:hypothetical protein
LERLGRANQEARDLSLRSLTPEQGARVLEGLISHPIVLPRPSSDHPVSLSHLRRRAR